MQLVNTENTVDGFRFINGLHTTSRQLYICSQVIRLLRNKQLPKELLLKLLVSWSSEEEKKNPLYKDKKGKITEAGEETTAPKYYLDTCVSLGMINQLNGFYACSRLSWVLLYFIDKLDNSYFNKKENLLSEDEKLFYTFQLLNIDADGILFVLDQLSESSKSQIQLQRDFKVEFSKRLIVKQELASQIVKNIISEKYRTINFVWKKPDKYSEHLLIPRCEWLFSLGLIDINKEGNFTLYSMTSKGKEFYDSTPKISNENQIHDISEAWLYRNFFTAYSSLQSDRQSQLFADLPHTKQNELIGNYLEKAFKVVKTSSSFKVPLFDSLLFICLSVYLEEKIAINFFDIFVQLEKGLEHDGKFFNVKYEGRINESYIVVRIL